MFSRDELDQAEAQVHDAFPGTPQYPWPLLAERIGAEVWVKHENHTPTGAFKVRGGLVHAARLARDGLAPRGLVSRRGATMASRWPMPGGGSASR